MNHDEKHQPDQPKPSNCRPNRREILKLSVAAAAGGGLGLLNGRAASASSAFGMADSRSPAALRAAGSAGTSGKPRNIIFMVVDGMSAGVPTLAEPYSQMKRGFGTNWVRLARDPRTVHGTMDTAALGALVTDSAAASCAWATGSSIRNGMVNILPDGQLLTPIGPLARDAGRALGLVTTTRITHATPAGFVAQVPRRGMEDDIAEQYLDAVDVLLGGGARHFDAATREDEVDLFSHFADHDYDVPRTRDAMLKAANAGSSRKLLGIFTGSHLPYTIDRDHNADLQRNVPTLAEMTGAALKRLSAHPHGFLLQIEGGRIDHAAHNNDAGAIFPDQLAFDDALGVALEFAAEHTDTLVYITTDHANANPGLNGMGSGYSASDPAFARLPQVNASFDVIYSRLRAVRRGAALDAALALTDEVIRLATGVELREDELTALVDVMQGRELVERNSQHHNFHGQLGQMLGNRFGVQWTGVAHTGDWVMSMATGPGSEHFHGFYANTDVYDRLAAMMGITHRNPSMTAEEAEAVPTRRSIGQRDAQCDEYLHLV